MTAGTEKESNEIDTKYGVITPRYNHKHFSTFSELLISTGSQSNENDKTDIFDRFFLITNFTIGYNS